MYCESDALMEKKRKRTSNYRVRFRHGVYPDTDDNATRADIKKYHYFFSAAQPWVHISEHVNFVDETAQVSSDNDSVAPVTARRIYPPRLTRIQTAQGIPNVASEPRTESQTGDSQHLINADLFSICDSVPTKKTSSPPHATFLQRRQPSPTANSVSTCSLDGRSSFDMNQDFELPQLPLEDPSYQSLSTQISNSVEARLFRFWVKCVGPRIDIVSPEKVFTEVIPRMACNNYMLLTAIFMIASQYILHVEPFFPANPYVYQERTLQLLVAHLASHGKIDDEESLVTAILLRGFEESHAGTRGQEHLSTLELFLRHGLWQFDMSSVVVQACFMIHVHFEICHALLCRPSLRVDYGTWALPALERPSNDVSWANKIVWICARILQRIDLGRCDLRDWYELNETVEVWERESPQIFKSLQHGLSSHTERTSLQDSRLQQCYVHALQHLCICRMALTTLYANIVHVGEEQRAVGTECVDIAVHVRNLVTIARRNMFSGWSLQLASHALNRFGTELDLLADRLNIMEFLEIVNSTAHPTVATQELLKLYWGW